MFGQIEAQAWGHAKMAPLCPGLYMLPRLAGGMMLFMRRYSTIWP
jgi:hypothetical protein